MRLTLWPVALLCALVIAPAVLTTNQHDALTSASLVSAAPARATTSYVSENRDLEEDDDDDLPTRATAVADSSAHTLKLRMLSALGAGAFSPRGEVVLDFAPAQQKSRARANAPKAIHFSPDQAVAKPALAEALTRSPSVLYRVAFVAEGAAESEAIIASVPACALVASHWHESFTFHCDPYGALLSVTYRTPLSACLSASEAKGVLSGSAATFVPRGKISFGRPGEKAKLHVRPGFDASAQAAAQAVGSEAPPPAPEQPKNADGSPAQPPQSFWQKYWMYIVPLGIFMVIQAVVAPPEEAAAARK